MKLPPNNIGADALIAIAILAFANVLSVAALLCLPPPIISHRQTIMTSRKTQTLLSMNPSPNSESNESNEPNQPNQPSETDYISPMRKRPEPKGGDMAYKSENILRQLRQFNAIRQVGGSECVLDMYAQDPNGGFGGDVRFWFVGKVARCTGTVTPEAAIARQYNLIEEHACRIRPVELGRSFGTLELWCAPGDSELKLSENDPSVRLRKMPRLVEGSDDVPLLEVGLNLEIVTNRGEGFCVLRTKDGVVPPHLFGQ